MRERDWILAIDIGNTQTAVGVLEGERLHALFRLTSLASRTVDELLATLDPLLRPYSEPIRASGHVAIASVVPTLTSAYEELAMRLAGAPPTIVSSRIPLPVGLDVPDPSSVGADRIANSVAAAAYYRLPAVVVDLGTATNFDVVLPGPRYVGGVIAPGVVTSAEELFRRGARLAKVELRIPDSVIGRTTAECIQSGVLFGAGGQIDGILTRIFRELGPPRPTVVATGGLAQHVAAATRHLRRVDPGLTMQGLRIIDAYARAASGKPLERRRRRS